MSDMKNTTTSHTTETDTYNPAAEPNETVTYSTDPDGSAIYKTETVVREDVFDVYEGIIGRKVSYKPFLIAGIIIMAISLISVIAAIVFKQTAVAFPGVAMFIPGVVLFSMFFYYRSQPEDMIKQEGEIFEIYDTQSSAYYKVHIDDILNIEGTNQNPRTPTTNGYLTFMTKSKTLKTGAILEYEGVRNYMLTFKYGIAPSETPYENGDPNNYMYTDEEVAAAQNQSYSPYLFEEDAVPLSRDEVIHLGPTQSQPAPNQPQPAPNQLQSDANQLQPAQATVTPSQKNPTEKPPTQNSTQRTAQRTTQARQAQRPTQPKSSQTKTTKGQAASKESSQKQSTNKQPIQKSSATSKPKTTNEK